MGLLSHNSETRFARRSIKGSEDAEDRLVSKKILSQKMAHCVGAQDQVKLVKRQKHAFIVTSPTENHKPNSKKFFNRN